MYGVGFIKTPAFLIQPSSHSPSTEQQGTTRSLLKGGLAVEQTYHHTAAGSPQLWCHSASGGCWHCGTKLKSTDQPWSRPETQKSHLEAVQKHFEQSPSPTTPKHALCWLLHCVLSGIRPPKWPNLSAVLRCQHPPVPKSVLSVGELLLATWPPCPFFLTGLPAQWKQTP